MRRPSDLISPRYWKGKLRRATTRDGATLPWEQSPFAGLLAPSSAPSPPLKVAEAEAFARAHAVYSLPPPDAPGHLAYTLRHEGQNRSVCLPDQVWPTLRLVHLQNVLVLRKAAVITENLTLAPQEYLGKRGVRLIPAGPDSRPGDEDAPAMRLDLSGELKDSPLQVFDEPCFYLDAAFSGAYGHFLLEAVSRFWAWPLLAAHDPAFITSFAPKHLYVEEFLQKLKLNPGKVRRFAEAAFCRDLFLATVPIKLDRFVHPAARAIWTSLADALPPARKSPPRRIYLSRRKFAHKRPLLHEDAVENIFRSHNFTVLYPEDLSLDKQIRYFRHATHIAGSYGSALHNTVFSAPNAKVMILSPFISNTYPLIDAGAGRDFTYYLCNYVDSPPTPQSPYKDESWQVPSLGDLVAALNEWVSD